MPTRLLTSLRATMVVLAALTGAQCSASDASLEQHPGGVILVYHHVALDTPASTSVSPQRFAEHLELIEQGGYAVIALQRLIDAIEQSEPVPPRSVAITFDDAYRSVYTEALPALEARGWPFTVFVSTQAVDDGHANTMTWYQLRELETRGGSVANHSRDHDHLVRPRPGEAQETWRARVSEDLLAAQGRLDEELEQPLAVFAYPYGEFDLEIKELVRTLGFRAVGQQSGPVGPDTDLSAIPRFPLATGFDSLDRLREKLDTVALPVNVLRPESNTLAANAGPPELELVVTPGSIDPDQLVCYVPGQPPANIRWVNRSAGRLTVTAREPLAPGRSKYTCTAPSTRVAGAYHWYSHLWMKPNPDGSWPTD
ncbi:MAG: polysaccharide deacetylase family protein [Pseudomonadales bacterium]|nr:polysaccharide deacetylase family protein [Pseudomonadales bacterium]NIX07890.1 polysaccharide deacetylase family protein [Pseudomonadales bacterium]